MDRIMGVITLKAPVYRQIAEDPAATKTAAIIVVLISIVRGFTQGLVQLDPNSGLFSTDFVRGVISAIIVGVLGIVAWVVGSWILAFVANMLGGKTNTQEMMRVTGYVAIFGIVSLLILLIVLLPVLGCLVGLMSLIVAILSIIGYVIGVREAAEFSTGKAIIAAIIAGIVNMLIVGILGGSLLAIFNPMLGLGG
ncbi:MAG: hypothetical protein HDKAJFGB_01395 [Anaerolineae bacterium]|nr:hypothetical protein [Anaerolineae bacterium]RIK33636.1 MAG: hypothetical protein DCC52_02715 [Chloroflexota bacterium]